MALVTVEHDLQRDRAGFAAQGQVAVHDRMLGIDRLDTRGDERRDRMALGIEQVARERGLVPLRIAKVHAVDRNRGLDARERPVVGIEHDGAGGAGHGADRLRESRVVDRELHPGMDGVERVLRRGRHCTCRCRQHKTPEKEPAQQSHHSTPGIKAVRRF